MRGQFNVIGTSETQLVANAHDVARSFFGTHRPLAMLLEVAYAQETIFVPDSNQPVTVNWAATVTVQPYEPEDADQPLPKGWVWVPWWAS